MTSRMRFALSLSALLLAPVLYWQEHEATSVSATQSATLSVTILIVDEKMACRPEGYESYGDDAAGVRRCESLAIADVEEWMAQDVPYDTIKIPPTRIPIGRLLPFLETYLEIDPGTVCSAQRKSAVFVFDWSEPQNFELSFRRESGSSRIRSTTALNYRMQGSRRWIHHERADSLAPGYRIVWVLSTGGEELRLRTTGGAVGP